MSASPPKADMCGATQGCPLWAKSGHRAYSITTSAVASSDCGMARRCRCSGNGIEFRLWCHVGRRCRCSGNGIEFRLWCHVGRRCRCSGNGTKAHSRSRKRLIGRLLNTTERNCAYDRDGDCPNACKDEGSHDQLSLCLRNGRSGYPVRGFIATVQSPTVQQLQD